MVDDIEHAIHSQGSYANVLHGVFPQRWGMRTGVPRTGAMRLLQGTVSHNDDPRGEGRIRVVLAEDAAQRPTPWVAVAQPSSGNGIGWHWIPEVGELVVVVADEGSPESLLCLGSVRGSSQKIADPWRSQGNDVKALTTRNGPAVVFDDRSGSLRLTTRGGAALELAPDGVVRLSGQKLEIDMKNEVSIEARSKVAVDAARIDLGK